MGGVEVDEAGEDEPRFAVGTWFIDVATKLVDGFIGVATVLVDGEVMLKLLSNETFSVFPGNGLVTVTVRGPTAASGATETIT